MADQPARGAARRAASHRAQPDRPRLWQAADAEAVLLALALCDRLPAELAARCSVLPPAPRGRDALCERAHLERLLPALLSSTSAHPRVHSVWAALVPLVARGAAASAGAAAVFWDVVCEQNLFTSSHERKCVLAGTPCTAPPLTPSPGTWDLRCSPSCCPACLPPACLLCSPTTSCAAW